MATTTTKRPEPGITDHLQDAVKDLDAAREHASQDVRTQIDAALGRIRTAAGEARDGAQDQVGAWEAYLERTTEDVRRDLGRRAIRVQSSPDALAQMTAEIGRRRAQLAEK